MSIKKGAKLELLKSIRDEKDTLFGCFSKTLTKQIKNEKWKEMHKKAQSLGIVSYEKDYTYTRDTVWQNIRKTTMKKIDNAKTTGSGGGPDSKLTDIDILVTDIIGKDSPVMTGLPVPDTWDSIETEELFDKSGDDPNASTNTDPNSSTNTDPNASTNIATKEKIKQKSMKKKVNKKEQEEELRFKKLKLSVEILEKESYERSLRILQLERELCLSPSEFTRGVQHSENIIIEVLDNNIVDENVNDSQ